MADLPQARKRWGQNFIHDPGVLDRMVRAIDPLPADTFIEIGPGAGALTQAILQRNVALHAVEVDGRMAEYLDPLVRKHELFSWETGDFLTWQPSPETQGNRLVGNIPYYITSPILMHIFELRQQFQDTFLLMQKEVAERLVAVPGTKAYGILSVYAALFSRPQLHFKVSRHVFIPKPDVDSAFIQLDFSQAEPLTPVMENALRLTVRTAFNQRRKTLRNSLKALLAEHPDAKVSISLERRPESLSPGEFLKLALEIFETH